MCDKADNGKAQYASCLAVNGVFCGTLQQVIEKGTPCLLEEQKKPSATAKNRKKKSSK
jgi:hypothetical protein